MNILIQAFRSRISRAYPWHFIGFLIIAMLIPKIYELSNVFWIGKISYSALAITEQYEFISVTIEIVNETIPFGILALVAQNYRNREKIIEIVKSSLALQLILSLSLMSIVLLFTPQFVSSIGTPVEIADLTKTYLVLKSIALPFDTVAVALLITIKAMRKGKEALYLVLTSVILNVFLDLFLISDTALSLHLGIRGVAIGYVVSKAVLMTISLAYLSRILNLQWSSARIGDWKGYARPLLKIGGWTGLDSLVRNIGYILVPLNVLNLIGTNQFGGYGLAMSVMWTLIVPVLAISEGTNVVVGNIYGERNIKEIEKTMLVSLSLVLLIMASIAVTGIFYWNDISAFFNPNPEMIRYSNDTFWWLIIPYCLFGVSMVLRSVFFGTGKTRYILYVSLLLNSLLIFPYWMLAKLGILQVTFNNLMLLFVFVFLLDILATYVFVRATIKKLRLESTNLPI